MSQEKNDGWQESNMQVFWGEIAPCDHVVQIYENDQIFMQALEGFVGSGLLAGDGIIIIGTTQHMKILEDRLVKHGFDLPALIANDQYIALEVMDALSKFFVKEWPDETLFFEFISGIIKRAQGNNRKVRAFGEMVATLWEKGHNGATVQLENLWNQMHKKDQFTLFCAYPRIGFTQDAIDSIDTICSTHTKVIHGDARPSTEIFYKTTAHI